MKEDEQKNNYQKQMLINRLYKTKNNPSANKAISKPQQDTNLLFYQTRKKSFKEEQPKKMLPMIITSKKQIQDLPNDISLGSARRTSRGASFLNKQIKQINQSIPGKKQSIKLVNSSIKIQPISPNVLPSHRTSNDLDIPNNDVATFFKMVRQKKLTADQFIYMIKKNQNDHYNMQVVPYSEIINKKIHDYYTFSCKGISKFVNSKPTQFVPVQQWIQEEMEESEKMDENNIF